MELLQKQHYIKLTKFLGECLGPEYEVVLYEMEQSEARVIAIANGGISGRHLGAPLSDMANKLIRTKSYMTMDSKVNYTGVGLNNKMLRCSLFFIKDTDGVPTGLLSIIFDDSRYQELSEKLLKLRHPDAFVESHFVYDEGDAWKSSVDKNDAESFTMSFEAMFSKAIKAITGSEGHPINRLTRDERSDFILKLKEYGVFELRQSVPEVARFMGCSPATIYRHLAKRR